MKASVQDYAHVCVLTMSGEFTSEDGQALRRALGERLEAGSVRHVILDCQYLEFIDSFGLESVLALQDELLTLGGSIVLAQPDETLRTILRMTRLDAALGTADSIDDAVRAVR